MMRDTMGYHGVYTISVKVGHPLSLDSIFLVGFLLLPSQKYGVGSIPRDES